MTLDESRVASAVLFIRRDGRPLTRDALEAAIWRMTAWKGEAEMVTALLDLIDEYAGKPPSRVGEPQKPATPARWVLGPCELEVEAEGCVLHHSRCRIHPHTAHTPVPDRPHLILDAERFTKTVSLTPEPSLEELTAPAVFEPGEPIIIVPSSTFVVEPEPEPTQAQVTEPEVTPEPVSELTEGEAELTKSCNKCDVVKPYSAFAKDKKAKLGLRTTCRECDAQTRRDRLDRKANPAKAAAEQKEADAVWVDAVAELKRDTLAEVNKLTLEEKRDLILAGKMIGSLNGA